VTIDQPRGEIEIPQDLEEALRLNPAAEAIWGGLPEAHRRGHVIAINRVEDARARAERVEETVEHLVDHHGSHASVQSGRKASPAG
jgi:uncharacterized protein YdeI (YjbR/CyaY-like superfamily)